jgi:hypothetical protein
VQQPEAGLELKAVIPTWLVVLSLGLFYIFPPKVVINGSAPINAKWGDNLIPMTPGRHTIAAHYLLYWFIPSCKAQLVVDIAPGQVAQVQYSPSWLFFLAGTMHQLGVRGMVNQGGASAPAVGPSAAQPAGWHPDPSGRHEMRYWSGTGWTDDVSDAGVAAKDPAG